jgi:hypothetical protein
MGILVAALAGIAGEQDPQARAKDPSEIREREEHLRTAPIITVAKTETTGRTSAWKVYLNGGRSASRAIFKYVNRQRPTLLPSSYRYELAAYELSKLLGAALIPPTVEREIDGIKGSLQCYCEGVISEAARSRKGIVPSDVRVLQDALSEVGILENLTYNPREDASDVLVNTSDWTVWRVDFSEAFSPETTLLADSPFSRCSKGLFQKLKTLTDEEFAACLGTYLNDDEIKAFLARKRLVLDKLETLIKEKGETAVLFVR